MEWNKMKANLQSYMTNEIIDCYDSLAQKALFTY